LWDRTGWPSLFGLAWELSRPGSLAENRRHIDLQLLRINRPDDPALDDPVAVNEECLGRSGHSEVAIRAVDCGSNRIRTFDFGLIGTGRAIGVLYVDAHVLCFAGSTLRRGGAIRCFLPAGYAFG